MRNQTLSGNAVLVTPHVCRFRRKELEGLAGRKPPQTWYEHLDDEAAARLEMGCGILKAGDLLVLRRQVHDRVRDEVNDRERAVDRRCREVADRDADLVG